MAIIGEILRVLIAMTLLAAGVVLLAWQMPMSLRVLPHKLLDAFYGLAEDGRECLGYWHELRHRRAVAERQGEVTATVVSAQAHIDTVMEAAARQMRGYVQNDEPTTWRRW